MSAITAEKQEIDFIVVLFSIHRFRHRNKKPTSNEEGGMWASMVRLAGVEPVRR